MFIGQEFKHKETLLVTSYRSTIEVMLFIANSFPIMYLSGQFHEDISTNRQLIFLNTSDLD